MMPRARTRLVAALTTLCLAATATADPLNYDFDLVIYGGTAGGAMAAVQAARMGKTVALIEPTQHLGGLTTGGLSFTDTGNTGAIQGIAREVYTRMGQIYGTGTEWKFEPKVAETVINSMVAEAGISVFKGERLDRGPGGVAMTGNRIDSLRTLSGLTFSGNMFIDAGYEGDLMAATTTVSYTFGREANSLYGETYNGIQVGNATKHQFGNPVDPYRVAGNPASGLLPGINPNPPAADGTADNRIQAYNFRLTFTKAANRLPWTAPANYDPANYELLRRYIVAQGITSVAGKLLKIDAIQGGKYDVNNQGPVSTDFIGMNYAYPDADYATRDQIVQAHRDYQQGLLYFLATDTRLPASIRSEMNTYGLCPDEFTDNEGWSSQLYIREARRLVGEYVMTDRNCRSLVTVDDPVALASYTMDSHNVERYVNASGAVRNEGDVQIGLPKPYSISYRSLTPYEDEAANLLVTSAISASHIAYGSIRMEPVFMELGQAAATAAVLAMDGGTSVQDVNYQQLQQRLIADGALITWPFNPGPPWTGTIVADFNGKIGAMRDSTGGTNFAPGSKWDGTGTENYVAGNLTTTIGGYAITQDTTTAAKVQGNYNSRRGNFRSLAGSLAGEIWFSFLLHNPDATASSGFAFNPENNGDPAPGQSLLTNYIVLEGDDLSVTLGGQAVTPTLTGLATGQTHLVVGRLNLVAGVDTFELWVDPANLYAIGAPDIRVTDRSLFANLTAVGILSWNPAGPAFGAQGGFFDALRISSLPGTAYREVTGVPEPASLAVLAAGGLLLARRRRRRQR